MKYEQPLINVLGSAQNTVQTIYGSRSSQKGPGFCKDTGPGIQSSTGAYEIDE
jgi:hypothetical protein